MGRARLWREGKLRCAKPFKFNLADVARLKVAQTGKGTAGHKLTRTYPYGRPHHLDKRNYNAKRVPRWMAAYLINYRSPLTMSITFSSGATLASVIMRRCPVAAHRTCRPFAGRRSLSRCAPRTRPARCCA